MAARVFDALALQYDELWTQSTIGRLQRQAVWRRLDDLFRPGELLLDAGCGTGADALHFMSRHMRVRAIDSSGEMVRIARSRGVDATRLSIEELGEMRGSYDGVISDFGALNCVRRLDRLRGPLARLVRSGGYLAICLMGRFCFWETAWYLLHAEWRKAFRRWRCEGATWSNRVRVYYPSIRQIRRALLPDFSLIEWRGIGVTVPPSYVTGISDGALTRLSRFDSYVEQKPMWRAVADHRLLIFVRR